MSLPIQGQLIQELRLLGPQSSHWTLALQALLAPEDDGPIVRWLEDASVQDSTALALAWKSATSMCNRALGGMRMNGGEPSAWRIPSVQERALWKAQLVALEIRSRVCLVLDADDEDTVSTCVVLTRAARTSGLTPDLARRLLVGQRQGATVDELRVQLLLEAFGEVPVYWGGPDGHDQPGRLLHGLPPEVDLPGSREIAAGLRIYQAEGMDSIVAAAKAVVAGDAQPLEFRLFVGHTRIPSQSPAWLPVACSRPLVLKHALASLPKPLWHEVMELCGGECAEMSRLVRDEESGGGKTRNPNRPRGDSDI